MSTASNVNADAAADANWAAVDAALAELAKHGVGGEVALGRAESWKAQVRLGEVEQIEGSTTRGFRVGAIGAGGRRGAASTSDIDIASVRACAAKAAELASYGDADEWVGLPPAAECGLAGGDLDTDDAAYATLDRDALLAKVVTSEKLAMASDPRITNAHRSSARAGRGENWYGTTDGVRVHRAGTSFSYSVVVVAQSANGERQTGGYGTHGRHLSDLWTPEHVAREAGHRAVRFYDWRKAPTGACKVLFDNESASDLVGVILDAVSGGAVYRGSTYLAGKLGETIASDVVTIIDNPLIPREGASRPCDGEGVRSRLTTIVEKGRLASYLVDGYQARRLKHPYTGHDGGHTNVRLLPGTASFDAMLKELGTGLLVCDLHGFGIDLVSGNYSRGVSGFWVENGVISHPVQEVTIAGNLAELLPGIRVVGNDPLPQSSVSSPSLIIEGFTVGGG
jgi:PmbA protein